MTFFSSFLGYQTFNKLNKSNNKKKIIFFSESKNYRNYLIGLIKSLEEEKKSNLSIIYLTSDKNDIDQISDDIKPIYIGTGFFMALLFYLIDCDILVMTLTDLKGSGLNSTALVASTQEVGITPILQAAVLILTIIYTSINIYKKICNK